jgi:hypothetical protein
MALTDNILAYWNLNDDGSGGVSLVDSTGNGYTLTNTNNVALGTGIIAGDGVFNGTNYLSNSSFPPPITGNFTYACWVNPDNLNGYYDYVSSRNTGGLSLSSVPADGGFSAGQIVVYSNNDGFVIVGSTATIPANSWSCLVFTCESGIGKLYINGTLDSTGSMPNGITSTVFGIGASANPAFEFVVGQIDEVGVWSRALSQADVTVLYNDGAGFTYPFVIRLYYNNAEADGDWGNILNWWKNSAFTIQATALPDSTTQVDLYNEVTQNTQGADQCFCSSANFWSANFGAGLTLQSTGVVNMQGSSIFAGTTTDGVSMHDSSQLTLTSVVDGNVVMRDSSRAFGSILGNATIYYDGGNGQHPIGGTVGGSVSYIGWPAISPQWFNDQATGGADDGDFNNPLNWWTDDNYNVRPINSVGTQQVPDASTDVVIAPSRAIYANTGTEPLINSLTANNAELVYITITISNGATFGGDLWGMYQAVVYGNVTFNSGSYNSEGIIHGTAKYTSSKGIQYAWNDNSLVNLNSTPMAYGSTGFQMSISEGGYNTIARLLNLPWFINI